MLPCSRECIEQELLSEAEGLKPRWEEGSVIQVGQEGGRRGSSVIQVAILRSWTKKKRKEGDS